MTPMETTGELSCKHTYVHLQDEQYNTHIVYIVYIYIYIYILHAYRYMIHAWYIVVLFDVT